MKFDNVVIESRVWKDGEDFVVTIPEVAIKLFGLKEGDQVAFEPKVVRSRYQLRPELQAIADELLADPDFRAPLDYLADR